MPLIKQTPTRVVLGDVQRVHHLNALQVRLHTGFGQTLSKRVIIESIDQQAVPPAMRTQAKKAMIVLCGGKSVLVHTDDSTGDGHILGRVYLNEKVFDAPEGSVLVPHTLDQPMLEIGTFFQWMRDNEFDITALKNVLNGKRRSAEAPRVGPA